MKSYLKDYCKQYITKDNRLAVLEALKQDRITQGKLNIKFENNLRNKFQSKYCLCTSNGSTGLLIAILALKSFNNQKNILLISNNTFIASSNASYLANLKIIPVDIDQETGSVDINNLKKIIKSKSKKILGFINTYYAGFVWNNYDIYKLCKSFEISYIEDACHAIGTKYYHKNKYYFVGSNKHSDLSIFSFHAVKNITTGEGGAIFCKSKKLYYELLKFRNNGIQVIKNNKNSLIEYDVTRSSSNFRLSDINAALGISQLKEIENRRNVRVNLYKHYLVQFKNKNNIIKPLKHKYLDFSFPHLFVVRINFKKIGISRTKFQKILLENYGIGSQVHYKPLHLLSIFKKKENFCKNSDAFYRETLSLPLHNHMKKKDVKYICESIFNLINEILSN